MHVIKLRSVVTLIERHPALVDIDLNVTSGEVVLLRGANGAGKSTLLHLCAGLRRFSFGTAEILGHDLASNRAAVRRNVALLGHDTALYNELTAVENLKFWAKLARVDAYCIPNALERLALHPQLWNIAVSLLSAGQRRRVALAAIVVRRPKLWLLDEPSTGLDSESREHIHRLVSEAAASGATVMMASHESDAVESLANREVTLHAGTVISDTSKRHVKK